MVAEGLRQLQANGVGIGLADITLENACVNADIARSSSHSAWAINDDYTPQVTYQRAVLKAWLLTREKSMFADAAQGELLELFADPDNPPSSSAIIRKASQAAYEAGYGLRDDGERTAGDYLSSDMALRYAIASHPPERQDTEALGWLREGEVMNRRDRVEDSYKPFGELLGLQPKPEIGELAYELFGLAVAALVEGVGLRNHILPEMNLDKPLYPTPEGEAPAFLIGLCVEALVPVFFEPMTEES